MYFISSRDLYDPFLKPRGADIFLYKLWRPMGLFNLKSSQVSKLAFSASFEYLCYGSAAIIFFNSFKEGFVFRHQNLTAKDASKDCPRTERVGDLQWLYPDLELKRLINQ